MVEYEECCKSSEDFPGAINPDLFIISLVNIDTTRINNGEHPYCLMSQFVKLADSNWKVKKSNGEFGLGRRYLREGLLLDKAREGGRNGSHASTNCLLTQISHDYLHVCCGCYLCNAWPHLACPHHSDHPYTRHFSRIRDHEVTSKSIHLSLTNNSSVATSDSGTFSSSSTISWTLEAAIAVRSIPDPILQIILCEAASSRVQPFQEEKRSFIIPYVPELTLGGHIRTSAQ